MKHFVWFFLVTTMLAMPTLSTPADKLLPNNHEVKYIIFMVPDGMGLADVTATRILLNCGNNDPTRAESEFSFCPEGPGGPPLSFEGLEHIGYQRTFSRTNTITDSSAAASAWACGEKFVNNEVCEHAGGMPHNESLLELAITHGWGTGLVATQTITHATPASFAAHTTNRNCENEIARQYIEVTRPDVLLGGGRGKFQSTTADACGTSGDFITEAQSIGYNYVETKAAMDDAAAIPGVGRLLGLFASGSLTPECRSMNPASAGACLGTVRPATQPRLPDMTDAALKILDRNKTGFFLMVEGSLVDSGNHAESLQYQYGEMRAFDEAVQKVLEWINASPERQQHTLLIVLADHETAGFAVKGVGPKGGEEPNQGLGPFQAGWVFTLVPGDKLDFEAHHTGGDVMIWSHGPGSEALGSAMDNTFVYEVVKAVIR